VDAQPFLPLDADRPAQAVERKALRQIARRFALAVDKNVLAVRPQDEIEQGLPLGRQQSGPERLAFSQCEEIIGHQPLEEFAHSLSRNADESSVDQGGSGHIS
jgi:hypothetical protein